MADLSSILFHKKLGSYREKAERLASLAAAVALDLFGDQTVADFAGWAGRLAKADLTTDMVREFTELQGTMGGIYAKEEGLPEPVWRAIYYQYLPQGVEPNAPPTREELGVAASSWAATSLADKLDTLVGMFAVGERPTGTRDPFGLRRQAHGALRILVDLPELAGTSTAVSLASLVFDRALPLLSAAVGTNDPDLQPLLAFLAERLRYLLEQRGYSYDEVNAVVRTDDLQWRRLNPLDVRRRLEALRAVRGSADFEALAVAFKRVKNLSRELDRKVDDEDRLTEPAERALAGEYRTRGAAVRAAIQSGNYVAAFRQASGFRPAVDKFFTDVFVMVDDQDIRRQRLSLLSRLHELLLELADISEIVPRT